MTSLKVSLYAGFAIALPVILWQIWSFLAPAVRKGVEKSVFGFVAFATVLFAAGIAFGYQVALPAAVHFLTNYDAGIYDIQIRASSYYSFALLVLLSVGLVFELPVFILALVRFGILTASEAPAEPQDRLRRVAALAVALPGVDPVTTVFEMVPLMLLFEARSGSPSSSSGAGARSCAPASPRRRRDAQRTTRSYSGRVKTRAARRLKPLGLELRRRSRERRYLAAPVTNEVCRCRNTMEIEQPAQADARPYGRRTFLTLVAGGVTSLVWVLPPGASPATSCCRSQAYSRRRSADSCGQGGGSTA